jgi:thiamine kinase-like enzyme
MLLAADRDLLARDRSIPGLAVLLDPLHLADQIQAAITTPSFDLEGAYLRYKPGTNCLAGYRVRVGEQHTWLYAKAYAEPTGKLRRALIDPGINGPLGFGRFVLPAWQIEVACLPNDWRIIGAQALFDADQRLAVLGKLLPGLAGPFDLELLVYKPERRMVVRVDQGGQPVAVIKLYTADGYRAAYRAAQSFRGTTRLQLPRLLGTLESAAMLAFAWESGQPLPHALQHGQPAADRVIAALSDLHAQPDLDLPVMPAEHPIQAVAAAIAALGQIQPSMAVPLATLAEQFRQILPCTRNFCPIHGDFYAKQVLLGDSAAVLLDLDEAAYGDPRDDLANLIAHLERDQLRGVLSEAQLVQARSAYTEAYAQQHRSAEPALAELHVLVAARLLRLALDPFRHREANWPQRSQALVQRAQQILLQ